VVLVAKKRIVVAKKRFVVSEKRSVALAIKPKVVWEHNCFIVFRD